MKLSFYCFVSLLLLFAGCSTGENISGDIGEATQKEIAGYVQKGPFIIGTSVTIQELTDKLMPTGRTFATQIEKDNGNFTLKGELAEDYAEIIADGYYYNEVIGSLSMSSLTLRTLSKLSNKDRININILTTLQSPRIRKLINEGKTFETAVLQSQKEVLRAFNIEQETVYATFDQWNIVQKGEENAILLAISSIMQQDRTEAELSEFISKVAGDLQDNGTVDAQNLKEAITYSASRVDNYSVQTNLRKRFEEIGMTDIFIPDFYGYLDSDGDGQLNNAKPYVSTLDTHIVIQPGVLTYTLSWTANCTPKIMLPKDCDWITITDCTNDKLVFTLTDAEHDRETLLTVQSPDNKTLKELVVKQRGKAMCFQVTMELPDMGIRTVGNDNYFDDKVSDICILTFDDQGKLLFVQKEDHPIISASTYKCYIKLDNKIFNNCTIFTIINSPYDFSKFQGDLSELHNLQSNTDLTKVKNLENFYIGETNNWTLNHSLNEDSNVKKQILKVAMRHPVAKVECTVEFINSTLNEKVRSLTLKGGIFYNQGSFLGTTSAGNSNLTLTASDNNQFTTYLYRGSFIEGIDLILDKGKFYSIKLEKMNIQAGSGYRYKLIINGDKVSVELGNGFDEGNITI